VGAVTQRLTLGPSARGAAKCLGRIHRGVCVPKRSHGQVCDNTARARLTRCVRSRIHVDTPRRPMLRFFSGGVSMARRWPADERSRRERADTAPGTTGSASRAATARTFLCSSAPARVVGIAVGHDRASRWSDSPLYFRQSSDRSHVTQAMHAVRATRAPGSSRKEPLWKTGRAFSRS
jgi:hypothetical protein